MSALLNQPLRLFAVLTCMTPTLAVAQTPDAVPPAATPVPPEGAPAPAEPTTAAPVAEAPPATAEAVPSAPAEEVPADAPAGKMDLSAPPPPPARTRQARVHNGFYLRGSFGGGGLWPKIVDRSEPEDEQVDITGGTFALSFEALVGASPADGFALGGGVFWAGGTGELSEDGVDVTVSSLLVGPFFDAFPNPKDGFHLGAMVGYASQGVHDHPSGVNRTHGFGGAAWLGYDWWVSNELSAGTALRFNGALTDGEEGDGSVRVNSAGVTLLITALYH
ncbi:MAG TPA: hypothetical protein VI197_34240 [Polyangiaceae bacterium]